MNSLYRFSKFTFALALTGLVVSSCKKKIEEKIVPVTEYINVPAPSVPAFRASFDYSRLDAKTPYDSLFLDENGIKTVDLTEGNNLRKMLGEMNTYIGRVSGANNDNLDSAKLKNMFYNSSNPFTDASLNASSLEIRAITGSSTSNPGAVRAQFVKYFAGIDIASDSVLTIASSNKAGKITANNGTSKYLLDSNGIELGQAIQKGFIGAVQLDYIANVLLSDAKLNADNHYLVPGKKYTELEHNWDVAFGLLTLNKVYAISATDGNNGGESFIGGYTREYGNSGYGYDYLKIHPAFLKGRAAVVNNDLVEAKIQANIIKGIFEKVVARAAIGYLKKWKDGYLTDPGSAAHAFGEGFGFIYSLRFCKINGADDAFSDSLLQDLVYSKANGVWDLTSAEATIASDKIKAKFGL